VLTILGPAVLVPDRGRDHHRAGVLHPRPGRLIFQAISSRDLITVQSVVMLLVFAVILVTFAVDVAYAAVDPRLRRR
jgi:ABC-type antimicrobial peptide transport system permease subunit